MAQIRDFYSDVDLKANQLFNSRLHNITTANRISLGLGLTTTDKGYQVYDIDLLTPYFWDGTAWQIASSAVTWGSITGTITAQTDLISYLSSNYYPLVGNPAGYITLSSLSSGTGINYNNLTGVITNTAPDQTVVLNSGTGISTSGTYPNFTITNTSPDQVVSLGTTGSGLSVTGTYPSFTLQNTLPDQTVALTAGTGIGITGTYPNFTISATGGFTSSLQDVTNVGNTTTNNINLIGSSLVATGGNVQLIGGNVILQSNLGSKITFNDGVNNTYINVPTTNNNTLSFPTGSGTLPISVNGQTANAAGAITIPVGTVTSVGLSMPSAFNVANSPVTSSGTLTVTGAGLTSQYIRGDGTLANFPANPGGGSSVSYYLNGSVNQGTFGGDVYHEMNRTPIIGSPSNFTLNANGYIANFITDAGDPALLNIPAGNWDFQIYFSASSAGGSPKFYTELYKYDGVTLSLIVSGSASPQDITNGTSPDVYVTTLAVPQTTLTLTDRLAIRVYVIHSGRTITMYTQDSKLAEIHTTFSTGLAALNGLTAQVQYFSTGTSGSDFNISSLTDTHTFNLPVASAINTGKLSSSDWSTFNNKQPQLNGTGFVKISGTTISYDNSTYLTSAITSLNGLTGSTQTFVNDTNVTIVSSGTTHTLTWSGTLGNSRISSASTWNSKIGGSGTTNEIAYFTASGTIASLTTGTYPSITELSYVKGVTSPVQTQIDSKITGGSVHLDANFSTSSTTATNTGLRFNVTANEKYAVTVIGTAAKATTSTGLRVAIGAPSGSTIKGVEYRGQSTLSASLQNGLITAINTLGGTFATGTNVEVPFRLEFVIKIGANAGVVELQLATVTSNTATVFASTRMDYIKTTGV